MAVGDMIRSGAFGRKRPGDTAFPITQEFGVYDEATAGMYAYAAQHGWPAGTHIGLDIGLPKGTKIFALNPGVVEFAGFSDSFRPKPVWIRTRDNPNTRPDESGHMEIYGHMWDDTVRTGQTVAPGDQLGISGEQTIKGTMEPDGTGPHLHFELREWVGTSSDVPSGWKAIDPHAWLRQRDDPGSSPDEPGGSDTPAAPDAPDAPDAPSGGVSAIVAAVGAWGKRLGVMLIGLLLLGIGAWVVVRPMRFTPIGRVVRHARR